MNRAKIILVAALVVPLAGCVLSGKPPAPVPPAVAPASTPPPPAPPESLSIPQTQQVLPAFQPVNDQALVTVSPAVDPAPPAPAKTTTTQPHNGTKPAPQTKPPETAAPPVEMARPPIQEILPPEVMSQLKASAQGHISATLLLVGQAKRRRLTTSEQKRITDIEQFMRESDQAKQSGDMRSADNLAERAHLLAKELQSGK